MSVSCTFADNSVSVRVGESCNLITASATALPGAELQTIQLAQNLNPSDRPLHIRLTIDVPQRTEGKIRFRTCQVVKRAARGFGEHPDRVSAVKRENLCPWIPEPLSSDQTERR
jgi:hypothetical protein